ncbi:MAG: alpha/beta hydrolase [Sphingomonadales bacterium]|nr:alpha/beta hydrolase [Sphingomonadales bacterium]
MRSLIHLIVAAVACLSAPAWAARWIGPLPETPASPIFAPAVLPGSAEDAAMKAAGYVQEEYLLAGDANIYGENADGSLNVRTPGVPYVTRLVLVRPRDARRFSGVVHIGFTHPQLASAQWGRIDALVLRSGAAYAMLAIGGDAGTRERSTPQWPVTTPKLFDWYDHARYAATQWPEDDGIRWDVMGQAATLLRDPGGQGPLAGLKVRHVTFSGWSFLGSTIRSWINFGFHDRFRRADGSPVVDGYLIGISAGSVKAGHTPLNSADPEKDRNRDMLRSIDRPVIELTSEMEAITNVYPQRAESDAVSGGHRIYELGGVSHGDSGVAGQVRAATVQLQQRRHPAVESQVACTVADTDVPMRDVAQAALVNLIRWVETGQAPPHADRMAVAGDGKDYRRDGFGNPLGGVRVAQLDLPLVRYGEPAAELCGGKVPRRNLRRLPVDPVLLKAAYPGGLVDYMAKFRARQAELVRQRWLLPGDAAAETRVAARFAAQAFPVGRGKGPANSVGTLASGARWAADVPGNWNGTLLLFGRGYSPRAGDPETAPAAWKQALLARGYALAASNYGASGWALAEAVPAQRGTIAAFTSTYGAPRRVIAWGQSMGGLVTTALAEQAKPGIDGGIALCPSIGGAVGMMNMALDGAFAFRTLVAPDAGLQLVDVADDMANGKRAQVALDAAMATPAGRARVALAGVLGGIPGWTRRDAPRPAEADYDAQADEMAASFVAGVFLPRGDQEKRAGGAFSWNTGIDYAAQLARSGRRAMVEGLYARAGISLADDLARLAAAPRVAAKPGAVAYMTAHYTPNARPSVPLLSVQAIGDGATSPSLQRGYLDAADPRMAAGLWLDAAGHCGMSKEAAFGALAMLEARLDDGRWPNAAAGTIAYAPPLMLRPCVRGGKCQ